MAIRKQFFNGTSWEDIDRTQTADVLYSAFSTHGLRLRALDEQTGCSGPEYLQPFPVDVKEGSTTLFKHEIDTAFAGLGMVYDGTRYTSQASWANAIISGEEPSVLSYVSSTGKFSFTKGANIPQTKVAAFRVVNVPVKDGEKTLSHQDILDALASDGLTYDNIQYTVLTAWIAAAMAGETDLDSYDGAGNFIALASSAPSEVVVNTNASD